jgi:hypothetical protein
MDGLKPMMVAVAEVTTVDLQLLVVRMETPA